MSDASWLLAAPAITRSQSVAQYQWPSRYVPMDHDYARARICRDVRPSDDRARARRKLHLRELEHLPLGAAKTYVCTSNVHDAPATSLPSPHRAAHSASYRAAKTFHSARLAQSFPQGSPLATTRGTHPARSSPKPLLAQVKKASQLAHATLPLHCSRASRAQGVRHIRSPRKAVPARTRMVERHEEGCVALCRWGWGGLEGWRKTLYITNYLSTVRVHTARVRYDTPLMCTW
ncbi:hypothetical protein OH76DRAFT_79163 [Lentinus brumalis]|uniref:Uncharacterized protein n=1 Tax=Lentinus brumalis TaxID=2498619 RepID=A0A371DKX3_9APHY|nr:hypothetical protein OH76DRAFT_79163 [Polyporus brumalis]